MWWGLISAGCLLVGFIVGVLVARGPGAALLLPTGSVPGSLDTTELHDGISFEESIELMTRADDDKAV